MRVVLILSSNSLNESRTTNELFSQNVALCLVRHLFGSVVHLSSNYTRPLTFYLVWSNVYEAARVKSISSVC